MSEFLEITQKGTNRSLLGTCSQVSKYSGNMGVKVAASVVEELEKLMDSLTYACRILISILKVPHQITINQSFLFFFFT